MYLTSKTASPGTVFAGSSCPSGCYVTCNTICSTDGCAGYCGHQNVNAPMP